MQTIWVSLFSLSLSPNVCSFFSPLPFYYIFFFWNALLLHFLSSFLLGLWECSWCLCFDSPGYFNGKLADVVLGFESLEPYSDKFIWIHLIFSLVMVIVWWRKWLWMYNGFYMIISFFFLTYYGWNCLTRGQFYYSSFEMQTCHKNIGWCKSPLFTASPWPHHTYISLDWTIQP